MLGTELALVVLTLSVVFGLSRLFIDNSYLGPTIVAAVGSHLVAAIFRRASLGTVTAAATSGVVMVFVLAAVLYGETTSFFVPTATTWSNVGSDFGTAWEAFGVVKAPTELLPGFTLTIAIVVWIIAAVADLAAFRVRTVVEAVVPATTLFIFTAMLGQPAGRVASTAAFLAALGLFLIFVRIAFPLNASIPIESTRTREPKSRLRSGIGLMAAAVVLGLIFGPRLPGVDQEPLLNWKDLDGGGGGSRVTLSPLVDARGRLVEQTDVELFRVVTSSETGAYWRTTALDTFDGAIWGSSYGYRDARGTLTAQPRDLTVETIDATISISNLGDIWFPAAFSPVSFSGANAKWDEESATLVTESGQFTTGVTYTVRSAIPIYDAQVLREASPFVPAGINDRYLALPDDFSTRVQDQALEITANRPTPYDKAIALQNFFQANFDYSTDVPLGHDLNRIEQFLFVERIGYCEQFAGTYAAMARSAGLPARVAVGFTPGDKVGDGFVVRGRNYHAWPEVWIDGAWIPFEPTPGRGSPQSETWTGVAPGQDDSRDILSEDEILDQGLGLDPEAFVPLETELPDLGFGDDPLGSGTAQDGGVSQSIKVFVAISVSLVGLGLAWIFSIPALEDVLRTRRRSSRYGGRAEVEYAWEDLTDALTSVGLEPEKSETRKQYVSRVAPKTRLDTSALSTVATLTDEASYGASEIDEEISEHARRLVTELESELAGHASQSERLIRRLHPGGVIREFKRR